MKARPYDWTHVVRANRRRLTAYIVSSHHPSCMRMAQDEVRFIDRRMAWVPLDAVDDLQPAAHWFMAVVVCPGDDLSRLARWAQGQDADRIHFYLHRDADHRLLEPWRDAGLPLSRIESERFVAYGRMHARLGLDLHDQIYGDFAP